MTATATATATLALEDANGLELGDVIVDRIDGERVLGDFAPGTAFAAVESVFRHFAEVVDQQSFSHLDEAQAAIARLGIVARFPGEAGTVAVSDVQIYPDGAFSCRLPV